MLFPYRWFTIGLLICSTLLLWGCWPRPYKNDIDQGNMVELEHIPQLRLGMTKDQVRFLLGDPIVQDLFNPQRWDYLYLLQPGYGKPIRRLLRLEFAADAKLIHIEGDLLPPDFVIKSVDDNTDQEPPPQDYQAM